MPNQSYALEWLNHAKRHLDTARLLFRENHYADIIALEIHQTIEKTLKSMYAYLGKSIPRTHSLPALFKEVQNWTDLNITIECLIEISDYYESERYPGPKYFLPDRKEIEQNLSIAQQIYDQIRKECLN